MPVPQGSGPAIAARFRADGAQVSICDRDPDAVRVAALADPGLHTMVGDIADAGDAAGG